MGHPETRWERSAAALALGLTAGLGFVHVDLVFFTLSVVLNPSDLLSANPWYYPIPRVLWFAAGVLYAAFPRLPRRVRSVGAMGCCLYWLGWLTHDLVVIERPLEVWVMWVGYIPLAAVSALLSWSNRRPIDHERYEMEAARLIGARIATLRSLTFDRASELPEASGEEALAGGCKCMLTTFRQVLRPDEILITVQLARPVLFGMGSVHREEGLVFGPGSVRDASQEELLLAGG